MEAIYTILEAELTETLEWWNATTVLNELDESYSAYQTGEGKTYTLNEVDMAIEALRRERSAQ